MRPAGRHIKDKEDRRVVALPGVIQEVAERDRKS
jgi:hypothetical protein